MYDTILPKRNIRFIVLKKLCFDDKTQIYIAYRKAYRKVANVNRTL